MRILCICMTPMVSKLNNCPDFTKDTWGWCTWGPLTPSTEHMSPEVPKIISCWLLKISLHPPFRMTTFGNNKKTEMTDGNKIWYTNMTVGNIMNISPTPSFMLIGAFEQPELFCQTGTDLRHGTANLRGPPTWNQGKTPPGNSLWMKLRYHWTPTLRKSPRS